MSDIQKQIEQAAEEHFKEVYFPENKRDELFWMRTSDFKAGADWGYERGRLAAHARMTVDIAKEFYESERIVPLATELSTLREALREAEAERDELKADYDRWTVYAKNWKSLSELMKELTEAKAEIERLQSKIDETVDIFTIGRLKEQRQADRALIATMAEALENLDCKVTTWGEEGFPSLDHNTVCVKHRALKAHAEWKGRGENG